MISGTVWCSGSCGDGVSPSRGGCGDGVSPSRYGGDAVATSRGGCGDGVSPSRYGVDAVATSRYGCGDGVSPSRYGCGDGVTPSRYGGDAVATSRGGCGEGVTPSRDGGDAVATSRGGCGDGVTPSRDGGDAVATSRDGCGDGVSPSRGVCGDGVSPSRDGVDAAATSGGVCGDGVSPSRYGGDAVATTPVFPGKGNLIGVHKGMGNALPRWSYAGVIYHICFRLSDSVPQEKLREWEDARAELRTRQESGMPLTNDELLAWKNLYSEKIERYLDSGFGACLLAKPGVADIVIDTIRQAEKMDVAMASRHRAPCQIHAYGIMPNHVHILVEIPARNFLIRLIQVWKSASSHRINRYLGRKGQLWQADYYNHIIRTPREYDYQKAYVFRNNMVTSWMRESCNGYGGDAVATSRDGCGDGVSPSRYGGDAVATSRDGCGDGVSPSRYGGDAVATSRYGVDAAATSRYGGDAVATPRDGCGDGVPPSRDGAGGVP